MLRVLHMKPARIILQAHRAMPGQPRRSNGRHVVGAIAEIFGTIGPAAEIDITSLADIEAAAAVWATNIGEPCAVWITLAKGQRTPRGFDAIAQDVSTIYRDPTDALAWLEALEPVSDDEVEAARRRDEIGGGS